jgi:ATP-dependent RNA helicase RhlE
VQRAIVFARTKRGANRIAEHLKKAGVRADAIHGNKSQNARVRTLADFQSGRVRALVATDIAARGLDIDGITHIINFDMPNEPEGYVHRVGRTARAGADGIALSFCDAEEVPYLAAIEKAIRRPVPVDAGHGFHAAEIARRHGQSASAPKQDGSKQNGSGRNGSGRHARPSRGRFNGRSAHRGRAVPAGRAAAG